MLVLDDTGMSETTHRETVGREFLVEARDARLLFALVPAKMGVQRFDLFDAHPAIPVIHKIIILINLDIISLPPLKHGAG